MAVYCMRCMAVYSTRLAETMRVRCMAVAYSHTANYIAFLYSARYIISVDLVLTRTVNEWYSDCGRA